MRHRLCHHQRFGRRLGDDTVLVGQMRQRRGVELMGGKRQIRLSRAEENKGRQCLGRMTRVPGWERVFGKKALGCVDDATEMWV